MPRFNIDDFVVFNHTQRDELQYRVTSHRYDVSRLYMSNCYKIRKRTRVDSSPPAGMSQEWVEYQVLDGRRVIARCGSQEAAKKAVADLEARDMAMDR
jgi:hypothetical protein